MSDVPALVAPVAEFVRRIDPASTAAVLCHSDADGLSAGTILFTALRRAGYAAVVEVTGKGGSAWSAETAAQLARHRPAALFVCALGCRPEPVLPGVPTLFLDHHRPLGVPPGGVLVTGYGVEPTPTSGLLAFEAAKLFADVADLDWVAAVSILGDLSDKAPFPVLAEAKARHKITPLKDLTALVNAPRRSSTGDARPALELMLKATGPRDALYGSHPETAQLLAAKAEVSAAFAAAKKAAPRVVGDVALVMVDSLCHIHPMIATTWRTRLAKNIVMAANRGYVPGQVNFSMRTASGRSILDFLRDHAPADAGPQYGHGHDAASGGALKFPVWNRFIASLGFGAEAQV